MAARKLELHHKQWILDALLASDLQVSNSGELETFSLILIQKGTFTIWHMLEFLVCVSVCTRMVRSKEVRQHILVSRPIIGGDHGRPKRERNQCRPLLAAGESVGTC